MTSSVKTVNGTNASTTGLRVYPDAVNGKGHEAYPKYTGDGTKNSFYALNTTNESG